MKQTCASYRRQLDGMADDGQLSEPLAAHVRECHSCRAEWDSLQRLTSGLSEALAFPIPQAATAQQVWARLELAAPANRISRLWTTGALTALAATAAVVFVLISSGRTPAPNEP